MKGWNRVADECCVRCGMELVSPKDAVMFMCTDCLEKTRQDAMKKIQDLKNKTGQNKTYKVTVPRHLTKNVVK